MQLENTDGYLLYKNIEGVINGIWFFDRKNKDNFYDFLKGIITKLSLNGNEDSAEIEQMTEQMQISTNMADILNPSYMNQPVDRKMPISKQQTSVEPSSYVLQKGNSSRMNLQQSPLLYMPTSDNPNPLEPLPSTNSHARPPLLPFLPISESQPVVNERSQISLLSKQQFKASLLQLVNNDTFIDSAYNEYLKSFSNVD